MQQNSALSPVWLLQILSHMKNLYMQIIFLQIMFVSNPIFSQFQSYYGKGWISYRSEINFYRSPEIFMCESGSDWGAKDTQDPVWYSVFSELGGYLRFWMRSIDWFVFCYFISLYISAIFCNIIQASIGWICLTLLFLNTDTLTNPMNVFIIWIS